MPDLAPPGVGRVIRHLPRAFAFARWAILIGVALGALWFSLRILGVVGIRYRQVDVLANVATVTSWTSTGIILDDGRELRLPDVERIDAKPWLLMRLVRRGVDVQPNGRVGVLVRISSGCGNCRSMKEWRLEYDLSALLIFVGAARPRFKLEESDLMDAYLLEQLEGNPDRELALTHMGGEVRRLEALCEENKIPLHPHVEREFAGLW